MFHAKCHHFDLIHVLHVYHKHLEASVCALYTISMAYQMLALCNKLS